MTSKYIKYKLLEYFRYNRQCIAADEIQSIGNSFSDIIAIDKKNNIIDIEIKVNKSDLTINEFKKIKHLYLKKPLCWTCSNACYRRNWHVNHTKNICINKKCNYIKHPALYKELVNKFYFAVTPELKDAALEIIEKVNDRYGLIVVNGEITIIKTAKKLQNIDMNDYQENILFIYEKILLRLSSCRVQHLKEVCV